MKQEFKVNLQVYYGKSSKAANGIYDNLLRESYLLTSKSIKIDNGTYKIDDVHLEREHPMYKVTVDLIIKVDCDECSKITISPNSIMLDASKLRGSILKDIGTDKWCDAVVSKIGNDTDCQVSKITKILNEDGFITMSMVQNITDNRRHNANQFKTFDSTHGWIEGDPFSVVYDSSNKGTVLFNVIPRDLTDIINAKKNRHSQQQDASDAMVMGLMIGMGDAIRGSINNALKASDPIKFKKDPLLVTSFANVNEYNKLLGLHDVWDLCVGKIKYIPTYVDSVFSYFGSIGYMKSGVPYINFMTMPTEASAIQWAKTLDDLIKVYGKVTLAEYYKCFGYNGQLDYVFGRDIDNFCWTTGSKAIISYNPRSREWTICFNTLPVPSKEEPKLKMLNGRDTIVASDYESGKAASMNIFNHINKYGYITLNEVCKINGIEKSWFDGDGKGWIIGDDVKLKSLAPGYSISFIEPIRYLTDDLKKVSTENVILYNLALKDDPDVGNKGLLRGMMLLN